MLVRPCSARRLPGALLAATSLCLLLAGPASPQTFTLITDAGNPIVSDPNPQVLGQELPALIEDGYTSFKVYMTYEGLHLNDGQMLEVLATARAHDGFVMVHCENDYCIRWLAEQLERAGETGTTGFSIAHGPVVEREATHRAISLAEIVDTPVFIVHVSAAQAMEQIAWAQSRGLRTATEPILICTLLSGR